MTEPDDEFEDLDEDEDFDEDEDDEDGIEFTYDATVPPDDPEMAELLERGEMEVLGLMPWSSNGTYLVQVERGAHHAPAIYKPGRGERPLWDFPEALWKREVAAYELSEQLGFGLVPTTVARHAAPMGPGSVQAFVPAQFAEHYFTIRERQDLAGVLRRLCAFDLVANSADRKGGHCLIDPAGRIWCLPLRRRLGGRLSRGRAEGRSRDGHGRARGRGPVLDPEGPGEGLRRLGRRFRGSEAALPRRLPDQLRRSQIARRGGRPGGRVAVGREVVQSGRAAAPAERRSRVEESAVATMIAARIPTPIRQSSGVR